MKENKNFKNYGFFSHLDAEILKGNLEKEGIPVKINYPFAGSAGKEASGGAYWTYWSILIRGCDFRRADEIKKGLNIKRIKEDEIKISLPTDNIKKSKRLRFFLAGLFISICFLFLSSIDKFEYLQKNVSLLGVLIIIFFLLSMFDVVFTTIKKNVD
jgi:hypothetical protein